MRIKLKKLFAAAESRSKLEDNLETDPKLRKLESGLSKTSDARKSTSSPKSSPVPEIEQGKRLRSCGPRDLTCVICNLEFESRRHLRKHLRKHSTRRPFKCTQCPKTFKTSYDRKKHILGHDEKLFHECKICKYRCKSKATLNQHHLRIHDDSEKRYICDGCGKQYKIKGDLAYHIKYNHDNNLSLVCEVCGESFKTAGTMNSHKRKHRKILQELLEKPFPCSICKQKFKTERHLSNHLLVHEGGIMCDECGKEMHSTKNLSRHKRLMHGRVQLIICSICKKPFKSSGSLRTHILTHTGERPYKCDQCGESFTQRSSMMRHRRSHPGRFSPPPPVPITAIVKDIEVKVLAK